MAESSMLARVGLVVLTAALSFVAAWFWFYKNRMELELAGRIARLADLEMKVAVMSTQISPLWAAVQSKIAKDLMHPSPQFHEMDALLRSLERLTITDKGRARLGVLLEERITSTDPEVSQEEKESAMLMKGIMRKVIGEALGAAANASVPSD